jgi:predicted Na+-dependent transporter
MASAEEPSPKKPEEIAGKVNNWLERLMPLITPTGVALGFLFPSFFIRFRPLVPFLFATITLSGALKLRARELGAALRSPLPVFMFFLSAHVIMPLLAYLLSGIVFRGDPDTVTGYVLLYATPTAVTGIIWVTIFRGDLALALALVLLDTLLAPLVMPGTVHLLLGTSISIDTAGMIRSLVTMVVIPTIAGVGANELRRGKIPAVISPYLNPLSKMLLVLIIAANVSVATPMIDLRSHTVWLTALVCICFSVLSFLSAKLTGILARLNPAKRTAFLFASALRNSTTTATIATGFFPMAAAQPAILMVMFQQMIAAFMGKILLKPASTDR